MFQRLPIAFPQVQAFNIYENLLIEICCIIYSLCWTEEITKKVYNNVLNSMKVWYEINAISMNSENSKTSEPYRILLNFADKINQERSDKYVALSNLSM